MTRLDVRRGVLDQAVPLGPRRRSGSPPVLLVAATQRMENPLCERLRVLTLMESGARAAELRGLRLGNFDLYRKTTRQGVKAAADSEIGRAIRDCRRVPPYAVPDPRASARPHRLRLVRDLQGRGASHRAQAQTDALAPGVHGLVAAGRGDGGRPAPKAAHDAAHVRDRRPGTRPRATCAR